MEKDSSLPQTLNTVPALLRNYSQEPSISKRGEMARKSLPALFEGEAAAKEEELTKKFERDQGILQKVATAERELATGQRRLGEEYEAGLKPYQEFKAPEYKASDYAANSAARLVTALLVGGVSRSSARAQLQAVKNMQQAESQGLVDEFNQARMAFDQAENARKDHNNRLKERFDNLMRLMNTDRQAALAEAKLIETDMGRGIIAAELRSGQYGKAYDLFNKAMQNADRVAIESMKAAAKPAKVEQLPGPLEKTLDNVGKANVALNRANQTRDPKFFGIAPSDAVADLIVSGVEKGLPVGDIMKSLGYNAPKVSREAVDWWKDYASFVAQVRNQLFGATLTPREAGDFRKFTIGPATDPQVADNYFKKQIDIINGAVERERRKGRARGVSDETLSAYLDTPQDEMPAAPAGGGGATNRPVIPSFASEAELDAAAARGEIQDGDQVTVGGRTGKYRSR